MSSVAVGVSRSGRRPKAALRYGSQVLGEAQARPEPRADILCLKHCREVDGCVLLAVNRTPDAIVPLGCVFRRTYCPRISAKRRSFEHCSRCARYVMQVSYVREHDERRNPREIAAAKSVRLPIRHPPQVGARLIQCVICAEPRPRQLELSHRASLCPMPDLDLKHTMACVC
jgi:hypothetical protein